MTGHPKRGSQTIAWFRSEKMVVDIKEFWVGESYFQVVALGEDAKSIAAIPALNYAHFQEGELVSALRSSGS